MNVVPMCVPPVPLVIYWTPPAMGQPHENQASEFLDDETIDALLLFQGAGALKLATRSPRTRQTEAERRAKHCAIQRRFMKRKAEAFNTIKHEVAKLEIVRKLLELEAERKTLELEQAALLENVRRCGLQDPLGTAEPCEGNQARP